MRGVSLRLENLSWRPTRGARSSAGGCNYFVTGTDISQWGYAPMTSPVNIAIYAFGALMLFALAIGFFAAPV
jgi:hypothetical protein